MSRKPSHFDDLPLAEKVGYVGAAAFQVAGRLAGAVVDSAARVVRESVAAFEREMDPNIEDAKIIEEIEDAPSKAHRDEKKAAR